jgi:glycogen(starch) synthase
VRPVARHNAALAMRVSVIISTCNRADSLRQTLRALRYQTYPDFEVVVVNGPSSDETDALLEELSSAVRIAHCPELHLSKSRNVGIAEAAGELLAFIDDDAIPEPPWLSELVAAYDASDVGGAGGLVYDNTGRKLQYRYSMCDRLGVATYPQEPPPEAATLPGADPFVYLQGTNATFRRDVMVQIGGFDEEIEYNYDEVEVCLQVIDRGYRVRALDGAAVHHRFLPNYMRTAAGKWDPFLSVKNRVYFTYRVGHATYTPDEVGTTVTAFAQRVKESAREYHETGRFSYEELESCLARVDRGITVGSERGVHGGRRSVALPSAPRDRFRRFPTLRPEGGPLKVCFVSNEYPPGDYGGVGRYTADLAAGFADRGHEVHVVTRSERGDRIDFEDGIWVHRLEQSDRMILELADSPLRGNFVHAARVYQEVRGIHERSGLDLVSAPLWGCEGLISQLDHSFPTVLVLVTSMRTIAGMHPSWHADPYVPAMLRLEEATVRYATHLHAISKAVLDAVDDDRESERGVVVPLGVRDRRGQFDPRRADAERVRVVFVGRLERRKGVDVLLAAAERLLPAHPDAELVLVGKDTENTETGEGYRESFERRFPEGSDLRQRVRFLGLVDEDELYRQYAEADIFCAPSRYESFGLVLLEAMMFGKPVVACRAGGMPEIVEEHGNGYLAEPGDVESLARCLERLLESEERRAAFGRRSRELFERQFSLGVAAEATIDAYTQIAHQDRADGHNGDQPGGNVADRLAAFISETTDLTPDAAAQAADTLLAADGGRRDYVAALNQVWHLSDEEFVQALYRLLLEREPDRHGRELSLARLASGVSREQEVRNLAHSEEAEGRGLDTGWLAQLAGPPSGMDQGEHSVSARDLPQRMKMRVLGLPVLGDMLRYLRRLIALPWTVRRVAEQLGVIERQLGDQAVRDAGTFRSFHSELTELRDSQSAQVQAAARRLDTVNERLGTLAAQADEDRSAHERFSGAMREWLSILQRKQEGLALDVREIASIPREDSLREPRIVDPDGLRAVVEDADGLRVNLGCGEKPLDGYVNVDARALPGVHVVGDVRRLPFEAGSVKELMSAHLIEHFRQHQLATVILPYWRSLLAPDGVLRTICPNWAVLIEQLNRGDLSFEDFKTVTFGLQDYSGDDHFAMYSPETLSEVLEQAGFTDIEVVAQARQNGLSPDMELLARPASKDAATPLREAHRQ